MLKKFSFGFALLNFLLLLPAVQSHAEIRDDSFNIEAAYGLIKRVIPEHSHRFEVDYIPKENDQDVFELESKNGKIILRGNNGVSVASALNYWLKNYAHCDISWNGTNLNVPKPFPMVPQKVRKVTPHQYRHYLNYCTFNYTSSWWDWERWQWEIDFMALNGIDMPLSMVGQNAIWDRVYRSFGFNDADMDAFFTGPAYFMWFWAGNIDAVNGPLPKSWMKSHEELGKKIIQRQRELGMKPILPAFSGHIPPTFKRVFPNAKIDTVNWEGRFADTYVLNPADPMFQKIGDKFMEEMDKSFGLKEHLYGADTFNEMYLPHQDSAYVHDIGKAVYNAMAKKDPKAVWVMQGWTFWDKRDFWTPERVAQYLGGVPDDNLIILDLFGEEQPIWNKTDAFYGKKWIWCMLHNFGGKNVLFGNLNHIAEEPARVLADPKHGRLSGIGLVPEGIEQNPVVYSLMLHHVWNTEKIDLNDWLNNYAHSRYGKRDKDLEAAWQVLLKTVYSKEGSYESIITARPTFEKGNNWANTDLYYNPYELIEAWDKMIVPTSKFKNNECYQFDLVTVGRQVMANYAKVLQQRFAADFKSGDKKSFEQNLALFFELIDDMDKLMATRKDFLLGKWLEDAKSWGENSSEKKLYEKNARNIITLWGEKDAVLHDYATKQWSGLFKGFYKKRWELFAEETKRAMASGKTFDQEDFNEKVKSWEWEWVNSSELYPAKPVGDPIAVSKEMYKKYAKRIASEYRENPELTKN